MTQKEGVVLARDTAVAATATVTIFAAIADAAERRDAWEGQ